MSKSATTCRHILARGLELASVKGLGSVTLGELAEHTKLSKSGVYAHFGSAQEMQLAILAAAGELAEREVVRPALEAPEGLPGLRRFFESFLGWAPKSGLPGGCPFVGAAAEFDDVPGPVHNALRDTLGNLVGTVAEFIAQAAALGQIRNDVDARHAVWQLFGIYTVHYTSQRPLDDPNADAHAHRAFEMLLVQPQLEPRDGEGGRR